MGSDTPFEDLVTPILDARITNQQMGSFADNITGTDDHEEISPGDSDYESSQERNGVTAKNELVKTKPLPDEGPNGARMVQEKINNVVTITKHKKIVLNKNVNDVKEGQARLTDYFTNKKRSTTM